MHDDVHRVFTVLKISHFHQKKKGRVLLSKVFVLLQKLLLQKLLQKLLAKKEDICECGNRRRTRLGLLSTFSNPLIPYLKR